MIKGDVGVSADVGIVRGRPLHPTHEWYDAAADQAPPDIRCRHCGTWEDHPDAREPCQARQQTGDPR